MLEVMKKAESTEIKNYDSVVTRDIFVTKSEEIKEYGNDESYTVRKVPKITNVTKKINEEKKLVKRNKALELIEGLEKAYTK